MILADTSIWIDHLRKGDPALETALMEGNVYMHPFILGELACGNLSNRSQVLALLGKLPEAPEASTEEVLQFIDRHTLNGKGVGWVDVHLLASAALLGGQCLWTRDSRLGAVSRSLGLGL